MLLALESMEEEFIDRIQIGFGATPIEILIVLLIIASLLILFIVFFIFQTRSNRSQRREYATHLFEQHAQANNLTSFEKELLERMAKELRDGENRKHHLITDSSTFDYAADRVIEKGDVSGQMIAALRLKLSFDVATEEEPVHSTTQLPEGTHIYFVDEHDQRFHGTVYDQAMKALLVRTTNDSNLIPVGARIRGYLSLKSGVYTFESRVLDVNTEIVRCEHSEKVEREQKRQYYRKELEKPVKIQYRTQEEEPRDTSLVDLGGGGARAFNPEKKFSEGDEIYMLLTVRDGEELQVPARVLQTSENGKYIHLRFEDIRETDRDKIIGYVLNV
jgi:competence protein ComGC